MLAAPNAFAMLGGPITVMLAVLLVAPAPLSVDEIGPVVLFCTPAAMPVTFRRWCMKRSRRAMRRLG